MMSVADKKSYVGGRQTGLVSGVQVSPNVRPTAVIRPVKPHRPLIYGKRPVGAGH